MLDLFEIPSMFMLIMFFLNLFFWGGKAGVIIDPRSCLTHWSLPQIRKNPSDPSFLLVVWIYLDVPFQYSLQQQQMSTTFILSF